MLRGVWNLPGPGIEPATPVLAGRFLPTWPPGKPLRFLIYAQSDSQSPLSNSGTFHHPSKELVYSLAVALLPRSPNP